jgi:hypothetical protein
MIFDTAPLAERQCLQKYKNIKYKKVKKGKGSTQRCDLTEGKD